MHNVRIAGRYLARFTVSIIKPVGYDSCNVPRDRKVHGLCSTALNHAERSLNHATRSSLCRFDSLSREPWQMRTLAITDFVGDKIGV